MAHLAAVVSVLRGDEILLVKREDFEVWVAPGGSVEPGESLAQAAVCEVKKEVGLDVELSGLVGIYSRARTNTEDLHIAMFAAHEWSGELVPDPTEVVEARFFRRDAFPEPMVPWVRTAVLDAMDGRTGLAYR